MMKKTRFVLPLAFAIALISATAALSDTVRTPLQSAVTLRGTSGGARSSSCGNISNQPNHQVQVTEAFTSLRFRVESGGQPTLFIQSSNGQSECVMADGFSGGSIEIPGVWEQGTYSVYVGDRSGQSHNYTLSIRQQN